MKKLAIFLLPALLAIISLDAQARHNRYGYNDYGYGAGHHRYGRDHYAYRGHGYRRHHRRHRGHHRRHSDHRAGYLVGGLLLGSLITHGIHRSNDPYYRRNDRYNEDPYITRRVIRTERVTDRVEGYPEVGRRLFRDIDGNCFERLNNHGTEQLIDLPAEECNW